MKYYEYIILSFLYIVCFFFGFWCRDRIALFQNVSRDDRMKKNKYATYNDLYFKK